MKTSIRTRLALALTAVMALIAAGAALLSWSYAREDVRTEVAGHLAALLAGTAGKIEGDVASAMRTVSGIADSIPAAALDKPAEIERFFQHLPSPLGWIGRCAAAAPDGRILAHNLPAPAGAMTSLAGRDYFRRVLSEKKPVVSAPLISGISGKPAIALSVPRLGQDGAPRLVVTCGLLLDRQGIFGHLGQARLGNGGYLILATRERQAIQVPESLRPPGTGLTTLDDPLSLRAAEGFEGTVESLDGQGRPTLFGVRQMASLGWFVAAAYPAEEAYQPLHRARQRILAVSLGALLLGGALVWFLAGWLVAPLTRLTRHLALLRERPEARMHALPRRDDEIGALADAFTGLLKELRQREDTIRKSEEKFFKAFHSNPDFTMISRLSDGMIVEVNQGFEQLMGIPAAEAVGRMRTADLHMWADPADRDRFVGELSERGGVRDFSSVFVNRRGERRQVEINASTIQLAGEPHIIGTARDVTALLQSQEDLRHSEERFAKAFHANPDYATVSRLKDGTFVAANAGFERLTGWRAEEVLGRTALDIGLWADPEERVRLVQELREHGEWHGFHAHFRIKGGEIRLVEGSCVLVEIGGEQQIVGVARDVTEVRRTEAALRESEEKFSKVFHASPDGMMVVRMEDGLVLDMNHSYETLLGCPREECIGRTAVDLGVWAYPEKRSDFVAALRAKGRVSSYPFVLRNRAGDLRDVTTSTVVIDIAGTSCLISVVRDVTDQQRAEEGLRASEERFAKAFRFSPNYTTITELETGRFMAANRAFEELTGYSEAEVLGRTSVGIGLWEHPEMRREAVRRIRAEGSVRNFPYLLRTRSGELRDCLLAAVGVEIGGSEGLIAMVRDVTDQKRAEEALRELNRELESRVRSRTAELEEAVREMESFSYSISHDLRAPLRAIAGYAKIIEEDYAAAIDVEGKRLLDRIAGGAIRMGELIDDLLDFSRIGRAELRRVPVDMAELAREALAEMPQLAESVSSGRVEVRIKPLPAVRADRSLLRQVWSNLIGNALKYSRQRTQAVIEIGGTADGEEVRFYVRDNGIGFDMAYADKLFHVFQRLHRDPAFEGTGVGLAIVARIVQRHGGRVWAEGVPDEGAAFHFALPSGGD
jgi:PAS domain S-box-containing protein